MNIKIYLFIIHYTAKYLKHLQESFEIIKLFVELAKTSLKINR